jgi:hypothetical protein
MKTYNFSEFTKLFFCGGITDGDDSILKKLQDGMTKGIESTVHPKELERQERLSKRRSRRNTSSATVAGTSPKVYFTKGNGSFDESIVIASGGFGFGTKDDSFFKEMLSKVDTLCKQNGSLVLFVRGCNDDPSYFTEDKFGLDNVKFLEDYSVVKMKGFDCLCIGGSLPFDRQWRKEQGERIGRKLCFDNTTTKFDKELLDTILNDNKIACIVTSDAPTFVSPYIDDASSSKWASSDKDMISDITNQRIVMDMVYLEMIKLNKRPYLWCFSSNTDSINLVNNIRFITSSSVYTMFNLQSTCEEGFGVGLDGEKSKKEAKRLHLKKMSSNYAATYANPYDNAIHAVHARDIDAGVAHLAQAAQAEENGWEAMFEAPALGDANHAHIQYDAAALDEMLRNYGRNNDDLAPANVGIEATAPNPFR